MPAAFEGGGQPGFENIEGFENAGYFAAQAEDIRIVVRPRHLSHVGAGTEGGADAGKAIRDDAHADAGGADQNPPRRLPREMGSATRAA